MAARHFAARLIHDGAPWLHGPRLEFKLWRAAHMGLGGGIRPQIPGKAHIRIGPAVYHTPHCRQFRRKIPSQSATLCHNDPGLGFREGDC
jgi:hypothetical protein